MKKELADLAIEAIKTCRISMDEYEKWKRNAKISITVRRESGPDSGVTLLWGVKDGSGIKKLFLPAENPPEISFPAMLAAYRRVCGHLHETLAEKFTDRRLDLKNSVAFLGEPLGQLAMCYPLLKVQEDEACNVPEKEIQFAKQRKPVRKGVKK